MSEQSTMQILTVQLGLENGTWKSEHHPITERKNVPFSKFRFPAFKKIFRSMVHLQKQSRTFENRTNKMAISLDHSMFVENNFLCTKWSILRKFCFRMVGAINQTQSTIRIQNLSCFRALTVHNLSCTLNSHKSIACEKFHRTLQACANLGNYMSWKVQTSNEDLFNRIKHLP